MKVIFCNPGNGCLASQDNVVSKHGDNDSQCKGHWNRSFIFECNSKCNCHFSCTNRVVQRGMVVQVQVSISHLSMFRMVLPKSQV
jgi:hypothetical protein